MKDNTGMKRSSGFLACCGVVTDGWMWSSVGCVRRQVGTKQGSRAAVPRLHSRDWAAPVSHRSHRTLPLRRERADRWRTQEVGQMYLIPSSHAPDWSELTFPPAEAQIRDSHPYLRLPSLPLWTFSPPLSMAGLACWKYYLWMFILICRSALLSARSLETIIWSSQNPK